MKAPDFGPQLIAAAPETPSAGSRTGRPGAGHGLSGRISCHQLPGSTALRRWTNTTTLTSGWPQHPQAERPATTPAGFMPATSIGSPDGGASRGDDQPPPPPQRRYLLAYGGRPSATASAPRAEERLRQPGCSVDPRKRPGNAASPRCASAATTTTSPQQRRFSLTAASSRTRCSTPPTGR